MLSALIVAAALHAGEPAIVPEISVTAIHAQCEGGVCRAPAAAVRRTVARVRHAASIRVFNGRLRDRGFPLLGRLRGALGGFRRL